MATERLVLGALTRRWWVVLIRGIIAIMFGVLTFSNPGLTLRVLAFMFGFYAMADGIAAIAAGVSSRWWSMVLLGALGFASGVVAMAFPGLTALVLLYIIAAWSIVRGAIEIVAAIELRKQIENEWWLVAGGVVSILFGLLLIVHPVAGAVSVAWIIGTFAVIFGVATILVSLRLRSLHQKIGNLRIAG